MPFAVSSVSMVTASSRSEWRMMNTAFSVGARLWYTSATVAKPSLSSLTTVVGAADEGAGVDEDAGDDIDGLDF